MTDNVISDEQEVMMNTQGNSSRNPIARSFGAGINQAQVIPNKRRDRKVKHRDRWREDNAWVVKNDD